MTDTSADFVVTATSTCVEHRGSAFRRAYLGIGHVLRSYNEHVVPAQYGIPDGRVAAAAAAMDPKM